MIVRVLDKIEIVYIVAVCEKISNEVWWILSHVYVHILYSSHNNKLCFKCNVAITIFLVSHMSEIRFHDVKGRSTVYMYSYAEILQHRRSTFCD